MKKQLIIFSYVVLIIASYKPRAKKSIEYRSIEVNTIYKLTKADAG
jgi:hypothetical protein